MYERVYKFLLAFYPKTYKQRFLEEMLLVLDDLKVDELKEKGKIGLGFWLFQFSDLSKSVVEENIDTMQKQGMKKYFRLNNYNIIGGILVLPVFLVFLIDIFGRIAQGDLSHYNRTTYNFLSHTPLYWTPILFTWIILFPAIAIILNIIPLLQNRKNRAFVKNNIITIGILAFGLFVLVLVKFHDFAPCFVHGIISRGFNDLPQILSYCSKA